MPELFSRETTLKVQILTPKDPNAMLYTNTNFLSQGDIINFFTIPHLVVSTILYWQINQYVLVLFEGYDILPCL